MASAITASLSLPRPIEGTAARAADDAARTPGFSAALSRASSATNTQLVAPTRTRLDASQARDALASAWRNVHGEEPDDDTVRILTAQWAHETGHGASMFNYNFGGIKGAGPSGLSVAQRTREGWGDTERTIIDKFRAYGTAEEGATDYVRLLAKRFPDAVESARAGDPAGFVRALKARGYFTGNEGEYTRSIVALSGMQLPQSGAAAPPPLRAAPVAPELGTQAPLPSMAAPLVDALAMADEISRAALRIARSTESQGRRG